MSNIYIQEPTTNGKVLLVTSVGDIDIELWSKEAPRACRNFVQLCMEGYYDNTIFHRVVKDFIVQGGDPTGTGTGGESIYNEPFKDEFHSRLRFVRRGLVAMANAGQHENRSQFFFTMGMTPELQGKHTIFGKVVGDTLFNMLKLQEVETDEQERPLYPPKIVRTEILSNPFEDILPRVTRKGKKEKTEDRKNKSKLKATKNFSLLSFGSEAEEDEEQVFKASKKFSGKSKSSHDLIVDPHLSSMTVVDTVDDEKSAEKRKIQVNEMDSEEPKVNMSALKKKLKKDNLGSKLEPPEAPPAKLDNKITEEDLKTSKSAEYCKEARKLQREIKASKKRVEAMKQGVSMKQESVKNEEEKSPTEHIKTDFLETFKQEREKYKKLKKQQKGTNREAQTLAMLEKFQSTLSSVKQSAADNLDFDGGEVKKLEEEENDQEDQDTLSWMGHKLRFEEPRKAKVLDANVEDSERYEIHDPRNPLTKRRRKEGMKKSRKN
ncbi:peptidyl-prolyl cis-trans isomerase cwc27 homolog [Plakobranchus ocellatus]|uniref:Spliceosome-associated protein CWC27 homolog n=1 Tax=Plakobranchus ocellatus TaxID=259542 RepID=A0AAV3ZFI9_9GAST|nr:peptidyl-prolyl cis-trans isomerase cwc27 homolog [Plakobranchus ocellatus]